MNEITIITKVPTYAADGKPLTVRLQEECDVKWLAGYRLVSVVPANSDIICIFQAK